MIKPLYQSGLLWLLLTLIVFALDQWTKVLASAELTLHQPLALMPYLNLTLTHNTGAAFSFLSDAGGWQRWFLSVLAIAVSGFLVVWLAKLPANDKWQCAALALILGGAIGNVLDRIRMGYVVDFIDVYYQNWHWPAFNVADSSITIGAVMLVIHMIWGPKVEGSL